MKEARNTFGSILDQLLADAESIKGLASRDLATIEGLLKVTTARVTEELCLRDKSSRDYGNLEP